MNKQTDSRHSAKKVRPFIKTALLSLGYGQQDAAETNSGHGQLEAAEHNSDRTNALALFWMLVGLVIVSIPYAIGSTTNTFAVSLSSVLGSLIISSAGITTWNNMYLRRTQMKETQAVISEKLDKFQDKIEKAFIDRIDWAKTVEASGIKNITKNVNTDKIREKLKGARNEHIKFLFISYATINLYWDELREALSHGCTITFLLGNPDTNSVINFYETHPHFQDRSERDYANICLKFLMAMKQDFSAKDPSKDTQDKFQIIKFETATPVVALQIGAWIYFGIPWFHIESFNGPWFEIDGENRLLVQAVQGHIDSLLAFAKSTDTPSLKEHRSEQGK